MAGSIGLIPESMLLPRADTLQQTLLLESKQSLSNSIQVSKSMGSNLKLNALYCLCFVTDYLFIATAKRQLELDVGNISAVFVVCSGLPKSALIEWHFVCFSGQGYRELVQQDPNIDPSIPIGVPERISTLNTWESGLFKGSCRFTICGFSSFAVVDCQLRDSVSISEELLENAIKSCIQELYSIGVEFTTFKVYLVDVISAGQFEQIFNAHTNPISALSIIPVKALGNNSIFAIAAIAFDYKTKTFIDN